MIDELVESMKRVAIRVFPWFLVFLATVALLKWAVGELVSSALMFAGSPAVIMLGLIYFFFRGRGGKK